MDKQLQAQIDKYQEQATEFSEIREDLLNMKADINVAALGGLLDKLNSGIDELVEGNAKKQYYDKDLCSTLKSTVTELVTAFSKIKSPTINFDLKPLQSIASDISKQNNTLIALLNKSGNSDNGELQKLVVAMIGKQNAFLDKVFQQADYSKQLTDISLALKAKNDQIEYFKIVRNNGGFLESVKPIYKT